MLCDSPHWLRTRETNLSAMSGSLHGISIPPPRSRPTPQRRQQPEARLDAVSLWFFLVWARRECGRLRALIQLSSDAQPLKIIPPAPEQMQVVDEQLCSRLRRKLDREEVHVAEPQFWKTLKQQSGLRPFRGYLQCFIAPRHDLVCRASVG